MKILILVMCHETTDSAFISYKETWGKICAKNDNPNIKILFLYSDENLESDYVVNETFLISRCKENYWDSLLTKVINGFDYFNKNDFDLVFKTNLSTIVNITKFYETAINFNLGDFVYAGAIGSYENYLFCSGAGYFLNKKSVSIILSSKSLISPEWTDDIFMGFILNKINNIPPIKIDRYDIITSNHKINSQEVKNSSHIRIKIRDGVSDEHFTKKVFQLIYE